MAIDALGVGLSGVQAYQFALNVSANNIANANTNGFKPATTDFHETAGGAGVFATISPTASALAAGDAPSQTDLTSEMVNLLQYKIGYEANAKVVQTQSDLLGTLFDTRT
jgi:flagellar basal-body rod protein FlgC